MATVGISHAIPRGAPVQTDEIGNIAPNSHSPESVLGAFVCWLIPITLARKVSSPPGTCSCGLSGRCSLGVSQSVADPPAGGEQSRLPSPPPAVVAAERAESNAFLEPDE